MSQEKARPADPTASLRGVASAKLAESTRHLTTTSVSPEGALMAAADRNLLFGILALQMDFITRDALVAAMNAWVLEKSKPLGQILVERGDLDAVNRALLEPLVEAHIRQHN